ncbi:MAG: hypothetical protein K6E19_05115, partial [Lachnospiraceae bacterium]|nr:hypothetical protein [Lachnospiraceae bacterium]
MEFKITRAPFRGFGAFQLKEGVYFAVSLSAFKECGVNIYDLSDDTKVYSFTFDRDLCYGDVYTVLIKGLSLKGRGYRFFCGDKEMVDRFAKGIAGNEVFGEGVETDKLYGIIPSRPSPSGFAEDRPISIPYEDSVIYLAHVRGLTMADSSVGKYKGTFKGIVSKIPYLQKLGVTSLLLMPVYEFIERKKPKKVPISVPGVTSFRNEEGEDNLNYWGFCRAFPYAIKASFAADFRLHWQPQAGAAQPAQHRGERRQRAAAVPADRRGKGDGHPPDA